MSIFDVFTGKPAVEAANQQRQLFQFVDQRGRGDIATGADAARGNIGQGYNTAVGAIGTGYGGGLDAFGRAYNTATGQVGQGFDQARGDINQGYRGAGGFLRNAYTTGRGDIGSSTDAALGYLDRGRTDALSRFDQAGGAYDSLAALGSKYGGATALGMDALGVNGAAGNARASDAFKTSDAYNFNLDQGLEAINRRRNMGGMLDSGNADRDAQVFGAGLASNERDKWVNNLLGFTSPELSATSGAASGRAGALTNAGNFIGTTGANMANLESSRGKMLADLAQSYGTGAAGLDVGRGVANAGLDMTRAGMLADLSSRYGTNVAGANINQGNTLAGLATGQGSALAGIDMSQAGQNVGLAQNLAGPYAKTYSDAANAEMAGSANAWGLGLNLAKLGTQAYGAGMFGGGAFDVNNGYVPNVNGGGVMPSGGSTFPRLFGW